MRKLKLLFITIFFSCSKPDGIIIRLQERDTTLIKYSFTDLKQCVISNYFDTISIEVRFRDLTDTIKFNDVNKITGSTEYHIELKSKISDTTDFSMILWCSEQDSGEAKLQTKFRHYFIKKVVASTHKFINRGKLNFYKKYNCEYIKISDTTITIKYSPGVLSEDILRSLEKNVCISSTYNWSDSKCESISWFDYIQNTGVFKTEQRGYSKSRCYDEGYVNNGDEDSVVAYAPYDIK